MKLKKCPFCGNGATFFHDKTAFPYHIRCTVCRARTNGYKIPSLALEAWEKRVKK